MPQIGKLAAYFNVEQKWRVLMQRQCALSRNAKVNKILWL